MLKHRFKLYFILPFLAVNSTWAKHQGKFSYGVFSSRETFEDTDNTGNTNDFLLNTSRVYLRLYDLTKQNLDVTIDLRDKYNSYEVLDRQSNTMSGKNSFQVRKLFVKNEVKEKGLEYQFGRFNIFQSGSSFVDGAVIGFKSNKRFRVGIGGGFTPQQLGRETLEFDKNSTVYGAFFDYFPEASDWSSYFASTLGYFEWKYKSFTDRRFIYNNSIYQWGPQGRVFSLIYLDFLPKTHLQNASIHVTHTFKNRIGLFSAFRAYDAISYRRVRGIREDIVASTYKEGEISTKFQLDRGMNLKLKQTYGIRDLDNKIKSVSMVTLKIPRYFSKNTDGSLRLGHRQLFTNKGPFIGTSIGYFTDKFETSLLLDYIREEQANGIQLNPIVVELTGDYQFSRKLFAGVSIQSAQDEVKSILSIFFKLAYRFGSTKPAPLRDGAAPRGRL